MSAKPPPTHTPLYQAIQKATSADLAQIDQEIASKQEHINALQAEADKLKQLRRTIDVLVNGKPARKKTEKKAKASGEQPVSAEARRKAVAQYLAKHGATKTIEIAEDLDIPHGSITFVLSTGAFAKTPNGIVLTPEGRQQYLEE